MRPSSLLTPAALAACALLAACGNGDQGSRGTATLHVQTSSGDLITGALFQVTIRKLPSGATVSSGTLDTATTNAAQTVLPCSADPNLAPDSQIEVDYLNPPANILQSPAPFIQNFDCTAQADKTFNITFHVDTTTHTTGFVDVNIHIDESNTDISCKVDCNPQFVGSHDANIVGLAAFPASTNTSGEVTLISLIGGPSPIDGNPYPAYLAPPVSYSGDGLPAMPKYLNSSVAILGPGTLVHYGLAIPGLLPASPGGPFDVKGGILEYASETNSAQGACSPVDTICPPGYASNGFRGSDLLCCPGQWMGDPTGQRKCVTFDREGTVTDAIACEPPGLIPVPAPQGAVACPPGTNDHPCDPFAVLETCGDNSVNDPATPANEVKFRSVAMDPTDPGGLIGFGSGAAYYDNQATTSWTAVHIPSTSFSGGHPVAACGLCGDGGLQLLVVDMVRDGKPLGTQQCSVFFANGQVKMDCSSQIRGCLAGDNGSTAVLAQP